MSKRNKQRLNQLNQNNQNPNTVNYKPLPENNPRLPITKTSSTLLANSDTIITNYTTFTNSVENKENMKSTTTNLTDENKNVKIPLEVTILPESTTLPNIPLTENTPLPNTPLTENADTIITNDTQELTKEVLSDTQVGEKANYILDNLDISTMYKKTVESQSLKELDNLLRNKIFTSIVDREKSETNLWALLGDPGFMIAQATRAKQLTNLDTAKEQEPLMRKLVAFESRLVRFRIKFGVMLIALKCSPTPALGLSFKFKQIQKKLKERKIILDLNRTLPEQPTFTVESTMKLVIKELTCYVSL